MRTVMKWRPRGTGAVAAVLILGLVGAAFAPASPRRASLHDLVFLNPPTFLVTENFGTGTFTVVRTGHGTARGTVDYATADGTAQEGSDYQAKSGTVTLGHPDDAAEIFVNVHNNSEVEAPETVNITLTNPSGAPGMILRFPFTGTMTIIDDDGPSRISIATATYSNFEHRSGVDVAIIRSGDPGGAASVSFATTDGTAVAGEDYEPVPPTTIEFAPGERLKRQTITFVNDRVPEDPERLTVQLGDPVGAVLADPSVADIEILDDDSGSSDVTPPVTNFHRPLNGATYKRKSPYAKELHVSPGDEGSGLDKVQLALRMKRRNGSCAWYRGSGFRTGNCSQKKWVQLKTRLFIVYQLKKRLKPSTMKTGIKKYTAFARAIDKAGNVERKFEAGRNKMTYRIVP
jgi:Calx-beta domain